jgi:thymidylate kinase
MQSKLFVFEGPDGSGKTTLSKAFAEHLRASGSPCEHFSFPGNEEGTLGKHVHLLHHDLASMNIHSIDPTSLQLLHVAAHIDSIEQRILPSLKAGHFVALDRFWWSTWVYGIITGAERESLQAMIELECAHWKGITPEMVFLVRRKFPKGDSTRPDFAKLLTEYVELADREARKYPVYVIENEGSLPESLSEVVRLASLSSETATV